MKNKLQKTYVNIFYNLKKNIENYSNNKQYKPNEFHCDLEIPISSAISAIFPQNKIVQHLPKYFLLFLFHFLFVLIYLNFF